MAVQGKFLSYKENEFYDAISIRQKVFVEEQNIPEIVEFDEEDKTAIHAVAYEGLSKVKAVATGRLLCKGGWAEIGRVAVLKEERGKQYGDLIVRMLIDKAKTLKYSEIYLNAQVKAEGFYNKIGFYITGEPFLEAGIQHIRMKYDRNSINKCCKID